MTGLVLAAAGAGRRFGGGVPKQFGEIDGKPVYLRSLDPFLTVCRHVAVVAPPKWVAHVERGLSSLGRDHRMTVCPGGEERQDSVFLGLQALDEEVDLVLVHDAARPFCSRHLVVRVEEAARRYGACIPAVPLRDTVKEVRDETVADTLDRSVLRLAQTPQGFGRALLTRAFLEAAKDGFVGTDESALVERLGEPVRIVAGEAANIKITWKEDL